MKTYLMIAVIALAGIFLFVPVYGYHAPTPSNLCKSATCVLVYHLDALFQEEQKQTERLDRIIELQKVQLCYQQYDFPSDRSLYCDADNIGEDFKFRDNYAYP